MKESSIQVTCSLQVAVDGIALDLPPPLDDLSRAPTLPGVPLTLGRQTSSEEVQFGDVVVIQLIAARKLVAMDWNGFSDPYAVFNLAGQTVKSSVKKATLNPDWHENFALWLQPKAETYMLSVMV